MVCFRMCGPKSSACLTVLSIWGFIQLSLMSIFFYYRSAAFVPDLNKLTPMINPTNVAMEEWHDRKVEQMDQWYGHQARNCGIAAMLYLVTLVVGIQQMMMNNYREKVQTNKKNVTYTRNGNREYIRMQ